MSRHIINIHYMKQQEILKKIGNILKELNEQYEYLKAEDAHLNDLELELFAANAKFLTDHNEILRKINAQTQNTRFALPEHPEPLALELNTTPANTDPLPFSPETETTLPGFSESAITFSDDELRESQTAGDVLVTEPVEEPVSEHEPQITNLTENYPEQENEPQAGSTEQPEPSIYSEPYFVAQEENIHHEHTEDTPAKLTPEETAPIIYTDNNSNVEEHQYTPPTPAIQIVQHPEPEPSVEAPIELKADKDSYGFLRREPEISSNDHNFSISSHTEEEPAPPHVDLTPVQSDIHHTEDTNQFETGIPVKEEQPASYHTSPVTEAPKSEPEQPLTLNQRLSAQLHPQTPSHGQQGPAVTDIKAAISMNDKLLFVKDLFNGYGMAYTEAIELLNRCKTFDEADRFLKSNYVVKNSWGDKPNTVDKFYAVLHRRFTS